MKKLLLLTTLLLLASCGAGNSTPEKEVVEDMNPDVTMLFAQTCENKDAKCKQLICNKVDWNFICTDNPLDDSKNCGEEKSYDKIVTKYKICSENKELLKNNIYNYSEKKMSIFEEMTANEIEKKIAEETAKVEKGGESEWLGTFLASAGWALIWGMIANKLFGGGSAQVPQRANNIENNRSINKESLSKTQADSKTATSERVEKRKADIQKRKESLQKSRNERKAKEAKAKSSSKSSSRKKRR